MVDETRAVASGAGLQEKKQATSILGTAKELATLQARFALSGYQLHRLASGRLLMTRWGLTREFEDEAAAAAFLPQIGGAV
ncbi:hypothetical protein [Piscinibacter koreensis]|uniref:Uncharacterized protein n=1 Tax=Piscinibacter koreensis TaxID=2742824 RepID=A0A7Y6NPD5_9BURK|nr:hypothetical protein [Schlegelella koreensis]NUZ06749.1 hypothetical protein [Schlegelella koreensis]